MNIDFAQRLTQSKMYLILNLSPLTVFSLNHKNIYLLHIHRDIKEITKKKKKQKFNAPTERPQPL